MILFLFYCNNTLSSQTIVNQYFKILEYDSNSVSLDVVPNLLPCDKALMIQMNGAQIIQTNDSTFGSVTNYADAGNYEILEIASVQGNVVTFTQNIRRTYSTNFAVQLVTFPAMDSATIDSATTCLPWNGSLGGVVFISTENLYLNNDINVEGKGFRGGVTVFSSFVCVNCTNATEYYMDTASFATAQKGEGIYKVTNPIFVGGKGSVANGGGAGNCKNGGGGGGSNAGFGGIGGLSFNVCSGSSSIAQGKGARSIDTGINFNKIFMGGGGGGGNEDNPIPGGTNGSNGGGIILIQANSINNNMAAIVANGADALMAGIDGAGGGGAGGTVLVDVGSISNPISIDAQGGNGGNNSNPLYPSYCVAPGGGGGGGLIAATNLQLNLQPTILGGNAGYVLASSFGCNNTNYGASNGGTGSYNTAWNSQFLYPITCDLSNSLFQIADDVVSFNYFANENAFEVGCKMENAFVQIFDQLGKLIMQEEVNTNQLIKLPHFNAGLYYVVAKTKNQSSVFKFIKY